jgi:SpoIIAA-like
LIAINDGRLSHGESVMAERRRIMLGVAMNVDQGYLELTVDGPIDKADYEAAVRAVDTLLAHHDQIDVVEVVGHIGWIEAQVWWKDIIFHLHHRNFLRRVAVVSDRGWVGPVTRLFAPLYPCAIRNFGMGEIEEARRWAIEGDTAQERVAA